MILVTSQNSLEKESVFVHYDAYDYYSKNKTVGYKEIVNPQPIFRERQPGEVPQIGTFDLDINTQGYYNIKLYGIASGYNGKL